MFGHWIFLLYSLLSVSLTAAPGLEVCTKPESTADIVHFVQPANDYGWQVSNAVAVADEIPSY
ncbi:MAG: hypothetical protein ABW036_13735 [Flavitalea sp.]